MAPQLERQGNAGGDAEGEEDKTHRARQRCVTGEAQPDASGALPRAGRRQVSAQLFMAWPRANPIAKQVMQSAAIPTRMPSIDTLSMSLGLLPLAALEV
jgi:hypothetical protein